MIIQSYLMEKIQFKMCIRDRYQDLRDEIISKEQFTRYREEFSAKERELEQAIREQEAIIRDIYENGIGVAKDLERFREGLVIGNLDRVALVSFIDRILIYDDFRVEIVFKYRHEAIPG